MKKSSLIIVGLLSATFAIAQVKLDKAIPMEVKNAFAKQFPNVKSVKWEKEEANYEASFDLKDMDQSALFDAKGNLLETETEIKDLPKVVADYVKAKYTGKKITESAKITNAKGVVTYEVEIKGKDLIFDSEGKFLKEIKN